MPTRNAHARWEGSLKDGNGTVKVGSGALESAYSFASRFESAAGTNPEELLGAAHASCFAQYLALVLGEAGYTPEYVDADANVTIDQVDGHPKVTKSHLVCEAKVPGLDESSFEQHAEAARKGCPVSQALAGTEITLDAKLVS